MPTMPRAHRDFRVQYGPQPRGPDRRQSASRRGYDAVWRRFRRMFLRRNPLCAKCGALAEDVHHVSPLSHGGDRLVSQNCLALCHACHSAETRAHGRRWP
jgi:5-methylcytosine-specific restriction protein A